MAISYQELQAAVKLPDGNYQLPNGMVLPRDSFEVVFATKRREWAESPEGQAQIAMHTRNRDARGEPIAPTAHPSAWQAQMDEEGAKRNPYAVYGVTPTQGAVPTANASGAGAIMGGATPDVMAGTPRPETWTGAPTDPPAKTIVNNIRSSANFDPTADDNAYLAQPAPTPAVENQRRYGLEEPMYQYNNTWSHRCANGQCGPDTTTSYVGDTNGGRDYHVSGQGAYSQPPMPRMSEAAADAMNYWTARRGKNAQMAGNARTLNTMRNIYDDPQTIQFAEAIMRRDGLNQDTAMMVAASEMARARGDTGTANMLAMQAYGGIDRDRSRHNVMSLQAGHEIAPFNSPFTGNPLAVSGAYDMRYDPITGASVVGTSSGDYSVDPNNVLDLWGLNAMTNPVTGTQGVRRQNFNDIRQSNKDIASLGIVEINAKLKTLEAQKAMLDIRYAQAPTQANDLARLKVAEEIEKLRSATRLNDASTRLKDQELTQKQQKKSRLTGPTQAPL